MMHSILRHESAEVLVTGATGLIGRGVVEELLRRGVRVRALTRKGSWPHPSPLLHVVHGDLRDPVILQNAARGVTHVIHLAACKSDEAQSEATNVGVHVCCLRHARTRIFGSSSMSPHRRQC